MLIKYIFSSILLATLLSFTNYPKIIKVNKQHHFQKQIPKGNYSGITWIGGDRYALVSDKMPYSGFYIFQITLDPLSGDIVNMKNTGFYASSIPGHDEEDICFHPADSLLFIAREADNKIVGYDLRGHLTKKELTLPSVFKSAVSNYGIESLTYNAHTHRFWTTSESTLKEDGLQSTFHNRVKNRLRLLSFDDNLQLVSQFAYQMDEPVQQLNASNQAIGVSSLAALDDGTLLVLERQILVTKNKLGSFVINRIYSTKPDLEGTKTIGNHTLTEKSPFLAKTLLLEWKTSLSIFHQNLANYEGMCLGPRLSDGSQVILLCADSQNQYGGILRDWFKTIIIR